MAETPQDIHAACEKGNLERVKELVQRDSKNVSKIKPWGHRFTPLHTAARWGHKACIQYLLENGADLNNKECGQTPLAVAESSASTYTDYDKSIVTLLKDWKK